MATLTPALVMEVNKDRGLIADGKLADLILVDGDPSRQMSDLGKITMVMRAAGFTTRRRLGRRSG